MNSFSNIKLASSFREISDALSIISVAIRFFALALLVVQAFLLLKSSRNSLKSFK